MRQCQCACWQETKHNQHHKQRYHRNVDQAVFYFRWGSVDCADRSRKHSDTYRGAAAQISAQKELSVYSKSGRCWYPSRDRCCFQSRALVQVQGTWCADYNVPHLDIIVHSVLLWLVLVTCAYSGHGNPEISCHSLSTEIWSMDHQERDVWGNCCNVDYMGCLCRAISVLWLARSSE